MIREAHRGDLDSLVALEATSFESDRFHRRQLLYLLTKARGKVLVYEKSRRAVGMLILSWRRNSSIARIVSVAVDSEHRGLGIGRALLNQAEAIAKSRGFKRMSLEVRLGNVEATRLYESNGYTAVALLPGYYWDGASGVRYQKVL